MSERREIRPPKDFKLPEGVVWTSERFPRWIYRGRTYIAECKPLRFRSSAPLTDEVVWLQVRDNTVSHALRLMAGTGRSATVALRDVVVEGRGGLEDSFQRPYTYTFFVGVQDIDAGEQLLPAAEGPLL